MTAREKTRPLDNQHCFRGAGLVYWGARASGLQPSRETRPVRDGHKFDFVRDHDGFPMNNGGIEFPEIKHLSRRKLIRFFPLSGSVQTAMTGNWWLDIDALSVMMSWAQNADMPLSKAVGTLLAVPLKWGDCRRFVVATPKVNLWAYFGKGKRVALTAGGQDISPDAARKPGTMVYGPPPGTNLEHIFIPGEPDLLARCMTKDADFAIAQDGSIEPPIY